MVHFALFLLQLGLQTFFVGRRTTHARELLKIYTLERTLVRHRRIKHVWRKILKDFLI